MLLTIAQRTARYAGFGDAQLSAIIGNPDVFAEKIRGIVDASGRRIARSHDWSVLLDIDNQITTVSGTVSHAMLAAAAVRHLLAAARRLGSEARAIATVETLISQKEAVGQPLVPTLRATLSLEQRGE